MSFNTKAFSAQDSLYNLLNASSSLSAWTVDFGLPSVREEQHIWVDEGVDEWQQESGTTGLVSRNESFRISVYLYSRKVGATAKEVRDELAIAASTVSDIVGSTPFLGGSVLYAETSGAEYGGAFADPEGRIREGYLRLVIGCQAFIA